MNSTALLSVLLSLGVAVIAVLWGLNEARSGGAPSGALEDLQRTADADIANLQTQLDQARDEIAGLKDENMNARRELTLEKESVADLMKANDRLVARLDSLLAGGQAGADGRDWTDEEIDLRNAAEQLTVNIREQKMPGPLGYQFVDWDAMRAALAERPGIVPKERAADQNRAYAAMGFVPPGTDVRERTLDFLEGQLGAALYNGHTSMLFQAEGTTKSIHDRTALARQIVHFIQDGNFGVFEKLAATPNNGDARSALWALATGDSNLVKLRFQLQDNTAAAADELLQSPTKMTREQFERIPAFLREELLFPYSLGDRFAQKLLEKDRWRSIDAAYANPPRSTAEILHPELYTEDSPYQLDLYAGIRADSELGGVSPIWDDVAGELRIALLLNQSNFLQRMAELNQPDILDMPELVSKGIEHFSEREGSKAAAGWSGDRFFVYPDPAGGESVYWRSKWGTPEDAKEFATAIGKSLAFRHKANLATDGGWSDGGKRAVKIIELPESLEVVVIDAANQGFGEGLEVNFPQGKP